MTLRRLFIVSLATLSLSGCITYSSDYANDGYYSSPDDSYSDYGDGYYGNPGTRYDDYGYGDDGYYGNPGNYGQYSYGSGGYSSISFSFNFGPSYSRYRYYPSYYGYYQCSPWAIYCYGGYNSGYGWGYPPYYGYNHHHHDQNPKPRPPGHHDEQPKHRPDEQPGFHPGYPIVDRPDTPLPRQPAYRPRTYAPVQHNGQTQPIPNGGTQNIQTYPRQQRPRTVTLPISEGNYRERFVEREPVPRQSPNYPQRQQQRNIPAQPEQVNNDYVGFSNTPRNMPTQQSQATRYRPLNGNQQANGSVVAIQQTPLQRAEPRQRPERRERAESKQREPKAEREHDGDKP